MKHAVSSIKKLLMHLWAYVICMLVGTTNHVLVVQREKYVVASIPKGKEAIVEWQQNGVVHKIIYTVTKELCYEEEHK